MVVIRLVDSKRWRIVELELEHNHQVSPQIKRFYKSHKKMILAAKSAQPQPEPVTEVHTIKLYRTPVMDVGCSGYSKFSETEGLNSTDLSKHLERKEGDAHAVYKYFCRMKLTNPNFYYLMDLGDGRCLRNVFWADARSRAAYGYFCDAVAIDTTCLANKFEIPLISFVGINHHGKSVLLGCGFLGQESVENFVWMLRAWLKCMLGGPPQVFITDQCKPLQNAVKRDHYCKNESLTPFFDGYVHKYTSFKEFVDKYDLALHRKRIKEVAADVESRSSIVELKTRCNFEEQLRKVYTKEIFRRLQLEVEGMYSCFNTRQVNVNGPILTHIVKERVEVEGNEKEVRCYGVLYETTQVDIRCICSLFNYKGYLCRHTLNVLNYNGMEEVPSRYILPRWSKDFKCRYLLHHGSSNIDMYNPVYWYNHLYKLALPVAEAGAQSEEHYKTTLQALVELLNKLHLVEDNQV
ncbi:protein FAR1-RELATED SEQUENCE 6-like [Pyrus ussuriensis x Pyrus communis]|uniref:Protein FAR1-RELATED SEQUENCE n=1 Tax=Pyrus ussuriensis x Pyrus communis TaxID=2448454 RepID=A0A5N5I2C4_9ROSA|nr:protein FAR1-RELATED SEQUENCE 6-like [Pyrus ussuriensis x Pyrus communis]